MFISNTEGMRGKIKQLRENSKVFDETKPKKRKGAHGKRNLKGKPREKNARRVQSKEKRKNSGQRGETEKYYLEDGTYEENKNFESWAKKLRKMWKKVKASFIQAIILVCRLDSVDGIDIFALSTNTGLLAYILKEEKNTF